VTRPSTFSRSGVSRQPTYSPPPSRSATRSSPPRSSSPRSSTPRGGRR
jgi:hypothetical protein